MINKKKFAAYISAFSCATVLTASVCLASYAKDDAPDTSSLTTSGVQATATTSLEINEVERSLDKRSFDNYDENYEPSLIWKIDSTRSWPPEENGNIEIRCSIYHGTDFGLNGEGAIVINSIDDSNFETDYSLDLDDFLRYIDDEGQELTNVILGKDAFAKCNHLKTLILPNALIGIKDGAFNGADSIESVVFANIPDEISGEALIGVESNPLSGLATTTKLYCMIGDDATALKVDTFFSSITGSDQYDRFAYVATAGATEQPIVDTTVGKEFEDKTSIYYDDFSVVAKVVAANGNPSGSAQKNSGLSFNLDSSSVNVAYDDRDKWHSGFSDIKDNNSVNIGVEVYDSCYLDFSFKPFREHNFQGYGNLDVNPTVENTVHVDFAPKKAEYAYAKTLNDSLIDDNFSYDVTSAFPSASFCVDSFPDGSRINCQWEIKNIKQISGHNLDPSKLNTLFTLENNMTNEESTSEKKNQNQIVFDETLVNGLYGDEKFSFDVVVTATDYSAPAGSELSPVGVHFSYTQMLDEQNPVNAVGAILGSLTIAGVVGGGIATTTIMRKRTKKVPVGGA